MPSFQWMCFADTCCLYAISNDLPPMYGRWQMEWTDGQRARSTPALTSAWTRRTSQAFLCLLSLENKFKSLCQWDENMMLKDSCNNLWTTKIFIFFLIFECDLCHFYVSCWDSQWVRRSLFTTSRLCAGQNTLDKILNGIAYANLWNWDRC